MKAADDGIVGDGTRRSSRRAAIELDTDRLDTDTDTGGGCSGSRNICLKVEPQCRADESYWEQMADTII